MVLYGFPLKMKGIVSNNSNQVNYYHRADQRMSHDLFSTIDMKKTGANDEKSHPQENTYT